MVVRIRRLNFLVLTTNVIITTIHVIILSTNKVATLLSLFVVGGAGVVGVPGVREVNTVGWACPLLGQVAYVTIRRGIRASPCPGAGALPGSLVLSRK